MRYISLRIQVQANTRLHEDLSEKRRKNGEEIKGGRHVQRSGGSNQEEDSKVFFCSRCFSPPDHCSRWSAVAEQTSGENSYHCGGNSGGFHRCIVHKLAVPLAQKAGQLATARVHDFQINGETCFLRWFVSVV